MPSMHSRIVSTSTLALTLLTIILLLLACAGSNETQENYFTQDQEQLFLRQIADDIWTYNALYNTGVLTVVSTTESSVEFGWDKVANIEEYLVLRWDFQSSVWQLWGLTRASIFKDNNLSSGAYRYVVLPIVRSKLEYGFSSGIINVDTSAKSTGSVVVTDTSGNTTGTNTGISTGTTTINTVANINWSTNAVNFRGKNGQSYIYTCPANGTAYTVWGSDVYTDDSSVCTAAVHAGLITLSQGGQVIFEISSGASSYTASTRNGVTTRSWGSWSGSFRFSTTQTTTTSATTSTTAVTTTTLPGDAAVTTIANTDYSWTANAVNYRSNTGKYYSYTCPAKGSMFSIWGTDLYTDDSSVCSAAVHAGLISLANGGSVIIEIRPGATSYVSSTRNGVTSSSWGSWSGSYRFYSGNSSSALTTSTTALTTSTTTTSVTTTTVASSATSVSNISWGSNAVSYRGKNGSTYAYTCPTNGTAVTVWGSDLYTDDSSVCTAAVHAGLITLSGGGRVVFEIRPGSTSYTGTTRNGISTISYGSWSGSFRFVSN